MVAVGESGAESGSDDPYIRLGLSQDATFEQVQAAKARCIADVDGDDQARARVEAAYDAVLMARLRDRQQGQVSPAAATASQREEGVGSAPLTGPSFPGTSVLQNIRTNLPDPSQSLASLAPQWSLVEGQGRIVRIIAGIIGLGLLLVSVASVQLVLALACIGVFLSQVRRGRRPLASLGWTLLALIVGLLVGSLLTTALSPTALQQLSITPAQIQALPAAVLLWLAALFLA
ncbi:MAG: molecular chaperone DnaJ [Cyanobium sp. SAT1300]|nr:molecular chaperone DnaJ [Cyanobium sp. SAT1300]|tara:strand:- start:1885 stop:2580 length:696 start_codon:yes stop_codon:yes gene_type:complete